MKLQVFKAIFDRQVHYTSIGVVTSTRLLESLSSHNVESSMTSDNWDELMEVGCTNITPTPHSLYLIVVVGPNVPNQGVDVLEGMK